MDSTLDIPFLDIPPTPITPPKYFTSAILRRAAARKGSYYNISPATIQIFEEIDSIDHLLPDEPAAIDIRAKWTTKVEDTLLLSSDDQNTRGRTDDVSIESNADPIAQACHTAAFIFWYLFLDESLVPFRMAVLQSLVRKLQYALSRGGMDSWVRIAPEAHTWVCLLGTAAALDLDDRVWFSLRHGQPVICIESKGASVFLQSWIMYNWANQRRKERMVAEEDIVDEDEDDDEDEEEDDDEDEYEDEDEET